MTGCGRGEEERPMSATTPKDVTTFWFRDATRSPEALERRGAVWFGADPAFDGECATRFAASLEDAARGALDDWAGTPRGRLALGDPARSDAAQHPPRLPRPPSRTTRRPPPTALPASSPGRTAPCTRSSASFCTCRSSMPRTSVSSAGPSSGSCRSRPRWTTPGATASPRTRITHACITTSSSGSAGFRTAIVFSAGGPPRRS